MTTKEKTMTNTTASKAKDNVPDLNVFGDGDMFALLCKASSQAEGWMKSTKAMEIPGAGCVVQVTTQQRNPDGSYTCAEAVTFVPGVGIADYVEEREPGERTVVGRSLIATVKNIPGSDSE